MAADATINYKTKRLKLHLGKKDQGHLRLFAKYIKYKNAIKPYIAVQDKYWVPRIAAKFDLRQRKTYNPPDISGISGDLFVAFVIGFIDGDGCIGNQTGRSDYKIRVKVHRSWLRNLRWISTVISAAVGAKPAKAEINAKGYANVEFANFLVIRYLKQKAVGLSLPYLARKWDRIDENRQNKNEVAKQRRERVIELHKQGKKGVEIARAIGLSNGRICTILKELHSSF